MTSWKAADLAVNAKIRLGAFAIARRLAAKNPEMTWMESRRRIARELGVSRRATREWLHNLEYERTQLQSGRTGKSRSSKRYYL